MTGADDQWAAYNEGDEAQNAELLEAVTSWAQGHGRENPRHRTRETLTDPGSCDDCSARSPAYNLPDREVERFALDADVTVYWPWVRPCWEPERP